MLGHTLAVIGARDCRHDAPNQAREASLVEDRAHFLLRSLRVVQPAGMENVKINENVVVRRDFRDHWKQRPRRLGEPGILGMRGEDVEALSFKIILSRCTALPAVQRHAAKVRELANAVVPPSQRLQH